MLGNVCEWCQDGYTDDYYKQSPPADPPGPSGTPYWVVRGGSWDHGSENCRSACRLWLLPTSQYYYLGFRVAADPDSPAAPPSAPAPSSGSNSAPPQPWLGYDLGDDSTRWVPEVATYTNYVWDHNWEIHDDPREVIRSLLEAARVAQTPVLLSVSGQARLERFLTVGVDQVKEYSDIVFAVNIADWRLIRDKPADAASFATRLKKALPGIHVWAMVIDEGKDQTNPIISLPGLYDVLMVNCVNCTTPDEVRRRNSDLFPKWFALAGKRPVVFAWDFAGDGEGLVPTCDPTTFRAFKEVVDRRKSAGLLFSAFGAPSFNGDRTTPIRARPELVNEIKAISKDWGIEKQRAAEFQKATEKPSGSPPKGGAAIPVRPVPLGGKLSDQTGEQHYVVFVPTRYGGVLTITPSAGNIENLRGPDDKPRENGKEVGENQHGWYSFKVTAADKPYQVETSFVQVGQAARFPWNFYYWGNRPDRIHEPWSGGNGRVDTSRPLGDDIQVKPLGSFVNPGEDIILPGPNGLLDTLPASGDSSTWYPNLYDDLAYHGADGKLYGTPAPLLKYDQLFGLSARAWEAAHSQDANTPVASGHALGGAVASIMLNEPQPAPGSGLTQDELKGLWAELGENRFNHRIGANVNGIPAGPPQPGPDSTDGFVGRFHSVIETHIRAQHQALLSNLRADAPKGTPGEVWNFGIGRYTAKLQAVPNQPVRTVCVDLEIVANSDHSLADQGPKVHVNQYKYVVTYETDGSVAEKGFADWISCGGKAMYCPESLMEVLESRWQGHNPLVTEANVRALDLANDGAGGKFARSAPPTFRSAATGATKATDHKRESSESPLLPVR